METGRLYIAQPDQYQLKSFDVSETTNTKNVLIKLWVPV